LRFSIKLDFDSVLTEGEALAWVETDLLPNLPEGAVATLTGVPLVVGADELANYIGSHITFSGHNGKVHAGILAQYFYDPDHYKVVAVWENGEAYTTSTFDTAIINAGGEYLEPLPGAVYSLGAL
jgi:hypothetical protein